MLKNSYNFLEDCTNNTNGDMAGTSAPIGQISSAFGYKTWSPLRRLGILVLLMYCFGIVCFLWSSYTVCHDHVIYTEVLKLTRQSWQTERRGNFLVIYNYVRADLTADKQNTVTLATAATLTDLHHVPEVCKRWKGPISVAIYAPGSDFKATLQWIFYMRLCADPCVRQNVTWHMYYDVELGQDPSEISAPQDAAGLTYTDCSVMPRPRSSFRSHVNLPHPANAGRNVARQKSKTSFVLVSDLHLYPSADIIPRFLKFQKLKNSRKKVYVLPVFQVSRGNSPPSTKEELVSMILQGQVTSFSYSGDHNTASNVSGWLHTQTQTDILSTYQIVRKEKRFSHWQPYFIFKKDISFLPEAMSFEGRYDRIIQIQELCLENYEFHILDNAFLIQLGRDEGSSIQDMTVLQTFIDENNRIRRRLQNVFICKFGQDNNCLLS